MKKVKIWLLTLLTVVMALFGLSACGETGVYKVTEYKVGMGSIDVDEDFTDSYIELKSGNKLVVSIDIANVATLEGTGTWEKGEEKNSYILNIEGIEYPVKIVDEEMVITIAVVQIVLEKD